jgi:23S rRNA (uracil1939-C5)-methyltransferase
MALNKDDCVTVKIQDVTTNGEGIGKVDGYTLFIKDAVIGDTVTAKVIKDKKKYGYGRLLEVVTPSSDRVEPRCLVARQCGGCQIQQMSYSAQLALKQRMVENNLERIGGITEYERNPIIGMENPFNYRNKAQYPVGLDKDGHIVIGFYAGRTHHIIDCMDCCIGAEGNGAILRLIKAYMQECNVSPYDEESHRGIIRHILIRTGYHTNQIMVCIVANADKLPSSDKLIEKLQDIEHMTSIVLNVNREKTNVILGHKCITLWGKPTIEDYICKIKYQISPLSFFQVNPMQTEKLYTKALEYAGLTGQETVWDLYCGIGTISLFLAEAAKKVYGVEIVEQAIIDARNNAKINGIANVEFFTGKAEEVVPAFYEQMKKHASQGDEEAKKSIHPDVIVVDPPRKGCEETLLATMVEMAPQRIVYVSCDSATLARDLKYLNGHGYQVQRVQPVDQFAHTVHVETVVLLSQLRNKPDDYIETAGM